MNMYSHWFNCPSSPKDKEIVFHNSDVQDFQNKDHITMHLYVGNMKKISNEGIIRLHWAFLKKIVKFEILHSIFSEIINNHSEKNDQA